MRLPFFGRGMTNDCVHSFGHSFVTQISFAYIIVRAAVVASPPFLSSSESEGMLSTHGDFPAFRLCTASSTSSLSTGRLSSSCVGVWLLWSRLVPGWISYLYRPLQYSVHRFRTAVHSVKMIPLLLSMTADLCCWVLVRALGEL